MTAPWPYPRRSELRRRAEARQAARIDSTAPAQYREDGASLLSLLDQNGGLDANSGGRRLSQWVLDYLYEKTWLSVVADIIPDWGTAKGFDLPGLPGPVAELLQSTAEDLQLDPVVQAAWKFARKDGGGALVKVLEDGRPSSEPIDYANLYRVKKLVALDRWELTITRWGSEGDVVGPLEYQDPSGARWHHTRVVPILNRELPLRRRPWYEYWSIGEYDRVYGDFLRDQDVQEALGKLLKEYSYDVLKIAGLRDKSRDDVKKALVGIGLSVQKLGKFALDANDDYVTQTKTMAGLPDSVKLITNRLAMITRIPASILLYESPGGLNSGANAGDWESLLGQVEADQKKHYSPVVANVLTDVLASRQGPTGGQPIPDRWRVQPRPLGRLSPQAESQVRSANATARAADISAGVVTVEEARRDPDVIAIYSLHDEPAPAPVAEPDGPIVPADASTGEAGPTGALESAAAGGEIQSQALNGAQVSALLDVLERQISPDAKAAVIESSFPTIPAAKIARMVAPPPATPGSPEAQVADEVGAPTEPEPTPGQPPPGEGLVTAAQVRERYGIGLGALKSMVMAQRIRGWRFPSGWRFLESEVATAGLHQPPDPTDPGGESETT